MSDPFDLRAFTGPDWKTTSEGGTGKPKKSKGVSQRFVDAKEEKRARAKKCKECRVCSNKQGLPIEAHHIVPRGAPHFGSWNHRNIMGLCLACHVANHAGDKDVKKRIRMALTHEEIEYSDSHAYQGWADDAYYRLPKVNGQTSVGSELAERAA